MVQFCKFMGKNEAPPLCKTSDKHHLTRPPLSGFYVSSSEKHQGYNISCPVVGNQTRTEYEIINKPTSPKISINIQRDFFAKQTWKQEVLKSLCCRFTNQIYNFNCLSREFIR